LGDGLTPEVARVEAGGVFFEVDAVAFDKDGTLVDLDAAWGPAALRWVETAAGADPGLFRDLASELGLDLGTGRLVVGGVFAVGTVGQLYETTLEVLANHGLDGEKSHRVATEARAASALAGEEGNLLPLGDVAGALAALHQAGLRLAVVSSDDRSAVIAAVTALGIGPYLDAVVAGDDGHAAKPAPDALLLTADRLGVEPGRLLYVGDSWVDAVAGRAAGIAGTVLVGDPPPEAAALAAAVVPGVVAIRTVPRT
jgi:HAD superfamily hydrolase (TIGR01549 family)